MKITIFLFTCILACKFLDASPASTADQSKKPEPAKKPPKEPPKLKPEDQKKVEEGMANLALISQGLKRAADAKLAEEKKKSEEKPKPAEQPKPNDSKSQKEPKKPDSEKKPDSDKKPDTDKKSSPSKSSTQTSSSSSSPTSTQNPLNGIKNAVGRIQQEPSSASKSAEKATTKSEEKKTSESKKALPTEDPKKPQEGPKKPDNGKALPTSTTSSSSLSSSTSSASKPSAQTSSNNPLSSPSTPAKIEVQAEKSKPSSVSKSAAPASTSSVQTQPSTLDVSNLGLLRLKNSSPETTRPQSPSSSTISPVEKASSKPTVTPSPRPDSNGVAQESLNPRQKTNITSVEQLSSASQTPKVTLTASPNTGKRSQIISESSVVNSSPWSPSRSQSTSVTSDDGLDTSSSDLITDSILPPSSIIAPSSIFLNQESNPRTNSQKASMSASQTKTADPIPSSVSTTLANGRVDSVESNILTSVDPAASSTPSSTDQPTPAPASSKNESLPISSSPDPVKGQRNVSGTPEKPAENVLRSPENSVKESNIVPFGPESNVNIPVTSLRGTVVASVLLQNLASTPLSTSEIVDLLQTKLSKLISQSTIQVTGIIKVHPHQTRVNFIVQSPNSLTLPNMVAKALSDEASNTQDSDKGVVFLQNTLQVKNISADPADPETLARVDFWKKACAIGIAIFTYAAFFGVLKTII